MALQEGHPSTFQCSGRPSQPLLVLWKGFSTTLIPPGGPPDHFQCSGRASQPLPALREGFPDHSRPIGRASQPLLDLLEGFPTTPGQPGGPPNHSRPT